MALKNKISEFKGNFSLDMLMRANSKNNDDYNFSNTGKNTTVAEGFTLGQRRKKVKLAHPVWKFIEDLDKFAKSNVGKLKATLQPKAILKTIAPY